MFRCLLFQESAIEIVALSIIVLTLQTLFTIAIVKDVVNNWNIDREFDETESFIFVMSIIVFALLSFLYATTAQSFYTFYKSISEICIIPWYILSMDFLSNILIGFVITLVSFFFLIESESLSDIVLNSFALAFIIELDDLANVFESDEAYLIDQDFKLWKKEKKQEKNEFLIRRYAGPNHGRQLQSKQKYNIILSICAWVLVSPFLILKGLYYLCKSIDLCVCERRHARKEEERVKSKGDYIGLSSEECEDIDGKDRESVSEIKVKKRETTNDDMKEEEERTNIN